MFTSWRGSPGTGSTGTSRTTRSGARCPAMAAAPWRRRRRKPIRASTFRALTSRIHELGWNPPDWNDRDIGSGAVPIDGAEWGAIPGTGLAATTLNGNPRVYYVERGYEVHELAWIPSAWNHRNLTKDATSPPVWWKDWSGLAATALGDYPRVYYQGEDGHIHELAASPRSGGGMEWVHRVVSKDATGPPAPPGRGYVRPPGP